ncbi:MAG: hypothetical protein E7135_00645 [Rikenellaceae bacterium]|nr:hypothetical protein [Rikenellaceae bacterium]
MDTLTIIITLVSVVAAVLQIILFFKIWGMCNDVRALRNQHCSDQPTHENNGIKSVNYGCLLELLLVGLLLIVFLVSIYK